MTLETPILLNEKNQDLKQYTEHDHNLLKYISKRIGILLEICPIKY